MLGRVLIAMLFLLGFGFSAGICEAQTRTTTANEIAEMLSKHDQALNDHDLEGVLRLFPQGQKTVVMGTGPGERFEGYDQIKEAYTAAVNAPASATDCE